MDIIKSCDHLNPSRYEKENCTHRDLFLLFLNVIFAQNAYKGGKKDGVWNYYGSNKGIAGPSFYNEGVKTGIWEFYDIHGALSWTYNFNTSTATYVMVNSEDGFYAYMASDGKWKKKRTGQKTPLAKFTIAME
jgi:hypothetical protein